MQLIEVNNPTSAKEFLTINVLMNKHNANYIRPLDDEVNAVFNPSKNKLFKYGEVVRWILKDDKGNSIGRIAAFTNSKYKNFGTDFATGGIGYFECINHQKAANILFNRAKQWLIEKGLEAMDGPINFGDRDKNWGLMINGFDDEPVYGMSFNPDYYQLLFENYGFKNFYNQYFFKMLVKDPLPAKIVERHEKFKSKPEYVAKHIEMKNLEKYANDFATIYNSAWAQHGEAKEITKEDILKLFHTMKPVMDETAVWFTYYKEEPIAMFINIPDVNQYFKHLNGKMGWLQKIYLYILKKTGACKRLTGIAFGVIPKFQALGIDSFMIYEAAQVVQKLGRYESYEMGWSGDWNPKMLNIYRNLEAKRSRHMITYRYIFDETNHPFERHPIMEYK
jgi:hypothetical protein